MAHMVSQTGQMSCGRERTSGNFSPLDPLSSQNKEMNNEQ